MKTQWVDANPSQGILGTLVTAAWLRLTGNHRHTGIDEDGNCPLDYYTAGGTANALTVTCNPPLTQHVPGMPIYIETAATNTAGVTLNVDGLGPVPLLKSGGMEMRDGDLRPGMIICVQAAGDKSSYQVASRLADVDKILSRIGSTGPAAGRNLADNADFQIWARGESVTVADGAGQCCADRHGLHNPNGIGATATMTKDAMQVDGVSRTCGKVSVSAAINSYATGKYLVPFQQSFEGRSVYRYLAAGKSFTVAVAVEVSVAGTYAFAVRNADVSYSYVHTELLAANTPTIVQFTVPIPPAPAGLWNCPNTAARGLDLLIGAVGGSQNAAPSTDGWLSGNFFYTSACANWSATAGATIKIARVRLEEGATLGAYQPLSLADDAARCRYFYRELTISNRMYAPAADSIMTCPIVWDRMRVAPTWVAGADLGSANAAQFAMASHNDVSGYSYLRSATAGESYSTMVFKSSGAEI